MRRPHPHPQSSLPISLEVYHLLLEASCNTGYEKEDWEIGAAAITDWVRRNNPDAIAMPQTAGYQWKQLFLPNGTLLRTIFNGKNHHCLVEGDQILYGGRAMSPSSFVNAIGGIRRNAWKCLWILLPDTTTWKLADSLRTKKRPVRARKALPAKAAQDAQFSGPLRSNDTGHPAHETRVVQPAPVARPPAPSTSTKSENTRGIGPRPHQLAETHPPLGAHPLDSTLSPGVDQQGASSIERRHGDNDAIEGLMRKAFLAFSRSLLATEM